MKAAGRRLVELGAAYFCNWGPGCSRFHDMIDLAIIGIEERRPDNAQGFVIMTSWHEKESVEEALYFAIFDAWPDDAFRNSCRTVLAVSVGDASWAGVIRERLLVPEELRRDVLEGFDGEQTV